jgi:ribose/xylose/arabinose/galactoside ABC-type transport system permease subunit
MKKLGKIWSEYSFIFVLIVIFIVYAITSSGLTWSGVMNIFRHSAVIGTVALGMGLICLTGEIDLSVGSMLALTAGFSVIVFNITGSILLTLLFALGFGTVCGFVNGLLVGGVQMPAFIVTLSNATAPYLHYLEKDLQAIAYERKDKGQQDIAKTHNELVTAYMEFLKILIDDVAVQGD